MPTGDETVQILIQARDQASKQIGDINQSVKGLDNSIQDLSGSLNTIMQLGGVGLAIGGLKEGLDRYLDYGATGVRLQNLEKGFRRFAEQTGENADVVLANMERMSQGMLTHAQLMEQYNKVYLLTGQEVARELPKLMQIAAASSAAGMGDFQYMLNSLTVGLGRLSPMILDNLGLSIKASEAYERYAASIGKASTELTRGEQQQALLNEIIRQSEAKYGDLEEAAAGAADEISQFRVATQELSDTLTTIATPAIRDFAEILGTVTSVVGPVVTAIAQIRGAVYDFATDAEGIEGVTRQLWAMAGPIGILYAAIQELGQRGGEALADLVVGQEAAAESADTVTQSYTVMADTASMCAVRARELGRVMSSGSEINKTYAAAIDDVGGSAKEAAGLIGMLGYSTAKAAREMGIGLMEARERTLQLKMAMDMAAKSGINFANALLLVENESAKVKGILDNRSFGNVMLRELDTASGGISEFETALEHLEDAWTNTIQGMMQPTTNLNITNLQDQMGLHEDTWDEFARRREDVFRRGKESPWTPEEWLGLPDEQVKARALQDIEDFYSYRLPEAINVDAIAQKVKEFIETQNNMQDVIEGVKTQLSVEYGIEATDVDVQRALGVDLEAIGTADGTEYSSAMKNAISAGLQGGEAAGVDYARQVKSGMLKEAQASASFRRQFGQALTPEIEDIVYSVLAHPRQPPEE